MELSGIRRARLTAWQSLESRRALSGTYNSSSGLLGSLPACMRQDFRLPLTGELPCLYLCLAIQGRLRENRMIPCDKD